MPKCVFLTALIALIFYDPQASFAQHSAEDDAWLAKRLSKHARAGFRVEELRTRVKKVFVDADSNGNGIVEKSDNDLRITVDTARMRSRKLQEWAKGDLDGDGIVTRSELEKIHAKKAARPLKSSGISIQSSKEQRREILSKLVERSLSADTNKDGSVTFAEALTAAQRDLDKLTKLTSRRMHWPRRLELLARLDRNQDNKITLAEFSAALEKLIADLDKNSNGYVELDEKTRFMEKYMNNSYRPH